MRKTFKVTGLGAALAACLAFGGYGVAQAATTHPAAAAADQYVAQGTRINICVSTTDESDIYVEEHSNSLGNCAAGFEQFSVVSDPAGYVIPSTSTVADTVTVTTPATQDCHTAASFSYQMAATSSQGLAISSWAITGQPGNLAISSNGLISGSSCGSSLGGFPVTVTATDSEGTIGSTTFDIEVVTP